MDPLQAQLYTVLLAQGVFWILGHCPGMCGPLVVAMRFPGIGGLLAYQCGKACTYALLGALAGGVGGVTVLALRDRAPLLLALTAGMMVVGGLAGLLHAWGVGGLGFAGKGIGALRVPAWLAGTVRRWSAWRVEQPWLGALLLGAVLALLPCAVVVWVLGLAVASASPLHGALLLVCLVLLNTPVLIVAHLLGATLWLAGLRRRLRWLPPLGLVLAGLWLARLALTVGAPGCHA